MASMQEKLGIQKKGLDGNEQISMKDRGKKQEQEECVW